MRAAYALGLHVQNTDPNLSGAEKEFRLRLWWALWLLERHLVPLCGRPTAIIDRECLTPHPSTGFIAGYTPEPRIMDQCLILRIELAKVCQQAIHLLYSPSVVSKSWLSVQSDIRNLEDDLQKWLARVPADLDFHNTTSANHYPRGARTLGSYFYMTRILMTKPCLYHLGLGASREANDSANFIRAKGLECVHAAGNAIDLLQDSLDSAQLYEHGPWYNQVNFVMQACIVILLGISFDASRTHSVSDSVQKMKKAIGWFRDIAKHNAAAWRAWRHCLDLVVKLAPRIKMDVSDIPKSPPPFDPPELSDHHHSAYPGGFDVLPDMPFAGAGGVDPGVGASLVAVEPSTQAAEAHFPFSRSETQQKFSWDPQLEKMWLGVGIFDDIYPTNMDFSQAMPMQQDDYVTAAGMSSLPYHTVGQTDWDGMGGSSRPDAQS